MNPARSRAFAHTDAVSTQRRMDATTPPGVLPGISVAVTSGRAGAPPTWWARVENTSRPPGRSAAHAAGRRARGSVKSTAPKTL